jgi:molybdopterin/thiamine biosynthesis adenylyltransferase
MRVADEKVPAAACHELPLLSDNEWERYRRQLMHAGFTPKHQEKLKRATALVAGIGGLGGTAAVYLAVAGIGRLALAHYGNLTISNMNRQILMSHDWIGRSRVVRAMKSIREINPDVAVITYDARTTEDNAARLLEGVDVALSARPNFRERRVLNAACVRQGVPMVEAAMNGLDGYLFNVVPGKSACLACLYPDDDPGWEELGFPVLGAVSGMLGCMMAIEAIKIITGFRPPLLSHMLTFSASDMEFRKLRIRRDADCPVCSGSAPLLK